MDLTTILLTPEVLVVAAGIVALLYGIGRFPVRGGRLARRRWWRRILPILPLALGVVLVFMPGVMPTDQPLKEAWGDRVLAGLWAGFVAAQGRKIAKRLLVDKLEAS